MCCLTYLNLTVNVDKTKVDNVKGDDITSINLCNIIFLSVYLVYLMPKYITMYEHKKKNMHHFHADLLFKYLTEKRLRAW